MSSDARIEPPFSNQKFDCFEQWVNQATRRLTSHPAYNDTEHGNNKGWRGHHFTALCFDSVGRRCRNGSDMMRARDEQTFPVWWVWPDQIVSLISGKDTAP